jgi:glycerophosphoryl diester phosphodiesterase
MPRLDRAIFLVPIAHRGLFDPAAGRIENTRAAFQAAIDADLGIECDVRPAAGGLPVVFHDDVIDRLIDGQGPVSELTPDDLAHLRYRNLQDEPIQTFADLLAQVNGRVPLLVEIKSEWDPPDHAFLFRVCRMAAYYDGPIALMSFDPAVIAVARQYAPQVPRGIISGSYAGGDWWNDRIDEERAARLRDLIDGDIEPDFYAYEVAALENAAPRRAREELGIPMFTWTVRSERDRQLAEQFADAPIFESHASAHAGHGHESSAAQPLSITAA